MRWQVEVTSMDNADTQSVIVEAESWQKALSAARAARGETGPISGFSIELLDEGYRAVNPLARRRYDVKRAPEGTPITAPIAPASVRIGPSIERAAGAAEAAAPSVDPPVQVDAPPKADSAPQAANAPPKADAAPRAADAPPKADAAPQAADAPPKADAPQAANAPPAKLPVAAAPEIPRPLSRRPPQATSKAAAPAPSSKRPPPSSKTPADPVEPPQPIAPPPDPVIVPTAIMAVGVANRGADATIRTDAIHVPPSVQAGAPEPRRAQSQEGVPPAEPQRSQPPDATYVADARRAQNQGSAPSSDGPPIPPTQVIFKREHDASERLPLTYREYVFTVARGVNEESGERLLRAQLDQVRASIASARPGKFVNLAVFDVVFQGKPPVPPLATLAWKDWTREPVVVFPRRPATNHALSAAAPIAPLPTHIIPPSQQPAPPTQPSAAPPQQAAPQPPQQYALQPLPPPPPVANNPFTVPFPTAPAAPFVSGAAPLPPGVPVPPPPGVPVPPLPDGAAPGAPVPAFGAPAAPAPAPVSAPPATLILAVPPLQVPPTARPDAAIAPAPAPVAPASASTAAAPPAPASAPAAMVRRPSDSAIRAPGPRVTPTPSRPSMRALHVERRATGDELIANLFEAMHELHFTRDVIEGGDYVLSLALDMIPSRGGLLHLYDIDRREYVVACAAGTGAEALLNRRIGESDPLFTAAMRKRRALVFADARSDESTASAERFVILGGPQSVIVSPIMQGGRFLGVLELMNPLDGIAFTAEEGNAIDYLSDQFGEFVAARGTQLDPDRIGRSVPPTGPTES